MSRHLYALPGGGGTSGQVRQASTVTMRPPRTAAHALHPSLYDQRHEPTPETVFVPLTPLEWSLIHQALLERGRGNSLRAGLQACVDLADKVRAMVRDRVPADGDPTPAQGMPRPS